MAEHLGDREFRAERGKKSINKEWLPISGMKWSIRDGDRGGRIWCQIMLRPRALVIRSERGVFRLAGGNVDWCSVSHEGKEFGCHIRVDAQAAVAVGHVPNIAAVETIRWFELNPERHGKAHVAACSLACLAGADGITTNAEAITAGTFLGDFVDHGPISRRRIFACIPNASRRYEQRTVAFHDVNHLCSRAHFDADGRGIFRTVSRTVVVVFLGKWRLAACQCGGTRNQGSASQDGK
jgi:hypothetical protein